ncbi:DUF4062 domain-containing protein, partial [Planctomycetota bacterium]
MTTSWRTVRVFISSTFKDMQAERDRLVRFVFPKLREELLHQRIHLVDVDLRWGVTSEQDSLQICKEIIDECRPRFLCMLGGRYGWTPPGREESITAAEVRYGVLDRLGEHGYAFFYFRDPAATGLMVEARPGEFSEPQGSSNEIKLDELKSAIAGAGLNPFVYSARWDDDAKRLIDLKAFGDRIYADLARSIDEELGKQPQEKFDEHAEENAAMEAFVEERTEHFVLGSRESVLNELLAHAHATGGNGYICLTGAPGSGKSALLAHLYRSLQTSASSLQLSCIIAHFVGASSGSTDVRRTLRRLCHELKAGCPDITAEIPYDPQKLQAAFPDFLQQASEKRGVVIVLDAVNQFDSTSGVCDLCWLPDGLPETARVILSSLDSPALEELRQRHRPPREIELEPLTATDAEAIIEQFRQRYRKRFEPEQIGLLLGKDKSGKLNKVDADKPLYLLAALEELRTLGTYEEITCRIAELPPDTEGLFTWILRRLEDDDGFRDAAGLKIGSGLVSRSAALLGASLHGLSQQELIDLLDAGDPQGNVGALLHLLRPYLLRRGELLDFYHGQFRAAVEKVYLESETERRATHEHLAGYFHGEADPDQDRSWKGQTPRPFKQLPFHLARANPGELARILFDYRWLRSKLNATDPNELIADYNFTPDDSEARLVQDAIRLSSHVLTQVSSHLPSQLLGRLLPARGNRIRALLDGVAMSEHSPWLKPVTGTLTSPGGPLLRTLTGHGHPVRAVAVTPDGRYVVSGSNDKTLRVWELASGLVVHTLAGHASSVFAVAVTPDGQYVVSGSADGTLMVWELANGRAVSMLAGHKGIVSAVAVTPDSRYAVSGSSDKRLKVWELTTGRTVHTLKGHRGWVRGVAVTPDGRYAVSGSDDKTLRVWDLSSRRAIYVRTGHEDAVDAVAVTSDGRYAISASKDKTLRVWEIASGRAVHMLAGHKSMVFAVAATPDRRYVVSGSADGTLMVWDLASGRAVYTLAAHEHWVHAVAVTPDGQYAVSVSFDKTLKVWELASGRAVRTLAGHESGVIAVAVTPDSQYAISGSDDRTLKVWELASGRAVRTLAG